MCSKTLEVVCQAFSEHSLSRTQMSLYMFIRKVFRRVWMPNLNEESIRTRVKGMIYFNMSPYMEPIVSMCKMFMREKLARRIHVHTEDHTILCKYMPKEILPTEYGGQAGSLDSIHNGWQKHLESYRDWFLKDQQRKVDESKRPVKSAYQPKQLFGVEGSFKLLSLD